MKLLKNQILENEGKKPILYDAVFKETTGKKPVVLFCHGYKGFKDWGAWNLVAERFAEAGFFFLKFNFSHNGGTVSQPIDFTDLDAFSRNNYSLELDDLYRVSKFVANSPQFEPHVEASSISLIGHSRGGGIVLLSAKDNPMIQKVVTWAGVSDFKGRFNIGTEEFQKWKAKGVKYVENSRTQQKMPHLFQFYEDFAANESRLTISHAVKALSQPYLIVHGSEDTTVPLAEAKALATWQPNSTLHVVEGANHVFGTKHPWTEAKLPSPLEEAVSASIRFLR